MVHERHCPRCHATVACREERTEYAVRLFCPDCDKQLATHFGEFNIA